jgi:protocatechuate 3,4-dioxygenase beta subunit
MIRVGASLAAAGRLALAAAVTALIGEAAPSAAQEQKPGPGVELRGRVQGPDGRPIAEARLYLIGPRTHQEQAQASPVPMSPVRATTGPDGGFRFSLNRDEAAQALENTWLLAAPAAHPAKGEPFGVVWDHPAVFDVSGTLRRRLAEADHGWDDFLKRREPVLRLVKDDAPLSGRVRDAGGRPVAGATVRVTEIWEMKDRDLTRWIDAVTQGRADYDKARDQFLEARLGTIFDRQGSLSRILATTTDDAGNFRLAGVGRERLVALAIDGPGVAASSQNVYARTRFGPRLDIPHDMAMGSEVFTYYGARFEYVAPPSTPVTGTVRDLDTGRPLEGIVVRSHKLAGDPHTGLPAAVVRSVTDAEGRYRLAGMPEGLDGQIMAIAYDQPYLPSVQPVATDGGQKEVKVDLGLRRGAWIRGRVTDAKSGGPVRCLMQYYAPMDSPNRESSPGLSGAADAIWGSYPTDREGRFAVPALRGRGILTALVWDEPGKYPRGAGAEDISGAMSGRGTFAVFPAEPNSVVAFTYHALSHVDIPRDAGEITRDFKLDPGATLRGEVLDPEGRPLAGASFTGSSPDDFAYTEVRPEGFAVKQHRPDRQRLLLFVHKGRKLSGSLIVRGPQEGPLRVKLQPWGVVTGRVVDEGGRPRVDLVLINAGRSENDPPEEMSVLPERYYITDKDGRFRIEGLAPGVPYKLVTNEEGRPMQQVFSGVNLEAGESRNLGDVSSRDIANRVID